MFKHILIPTDGSKLSAEAAAAGVKLARALGARVTVLFAAPPATPIIYRDALPAGYGTTGSHKAMIEKTAQTYLGAVRKAARAAGVACQGLSVTSDFPADTILETARKRGCDLVFMASHARRGLRGLLLGSQTQKVLSNAKLPVLVYRRGG